MVIDVVAWKIYIAWRLVCAVSELVRWKISRLNRRLAWLFVP